MAVERYGHQEKKSIWGSRLFKVGLLVFGAGVVVNSLLLAEAGVLSSAAGATWHFATGKKN